MVFVDIATAGTSGTSLTPVGVGPDEGMLAWAIIRSTDRDADPSHDDTHAATLVERGALHSAEAALAMTMLAVRRAAFVAGRVALRAAIHAIAPGRDDVPLLLARPLLRTTRGAPTLPAGVLGSISHKRTHALAIALVGHSGHVGVDLEERPNASDALRPSIAPRILTAREQDALSSLDPLAHRDATLLLQVVLVHRPLGHDLVVAERTGLAEQLVHQRRLAVVNVSNRAHVHVGLGALKLAFCHFLSSSNIVINVNSNLFFSVDNRFRNMLGRLSVVFEFHRVGGTTLGGRAKRCGITKHF